MILVSKHRFLGSRKQMVTFLNTLVAILNAIPPYGGFKTAKSANSDYKVLVLSKLVSNIDLWGQRSIWRQFQLKWTPHWTPCRHMAASKLLKRLNPLINYLFLSQLVFKGRFIGSEMLMAILYAILNAIPPYGGWIWTKSATYWILLSELNDSRLKWYTLLCQCSCK